MPSMDSRIFKNRIQRRLYHACASDCDSDSEIDGLDASTLPLTETCMEYFQDSFPGSEGLGRLDMPMAATITKRNQVSPCSVVLSLMYAKRLRQRNRQYLQSMSSTDVFFISMMMASKYMYDEGVDEEVYNDEWAASVGHETEDVNKMEMDFLKEMDWQLFAKHEDFDKALTAVERRMALNEGLKRGWFTYTEMAVLLDWDHVYNMWNQVSMDCTKVLSLLSAVYVTSLFSMMGSAAVAVQLSGPMASATVAAVISLHSTSTILTASTHSLTTSPLLAVTTMHNNLSSEDTTNGVGGGADDLVANDAVASLSSRLGGLDDSVADSGNRFHKNCSRFQSGVPGVDGIEDSEEEESDNCATLSKPKMKGASSVLSMWLFDSIISHVWSVFGSTSGNGHSSDTQQNVESGISSGFEFERDTGKGCVNCGRIENRNRKGDNKNKSRRCRNQQRTTTHVSMKEDDVENVVWSMDRLSIDEANRGVGSGHDPVNVNSCASSSSSGSDCLHTGPDQLPSIFNTDSCQCSSLSSSPNCPCASTTKPEVDRKVNVRDVDVHGPHFRQKVNMEETPDLVLPLSLMTEVPIIDSIGFLTKDSYPANYVLST